LYSSAVTAPSLASFNEKIRQAVEANNEEAMLNQMEEMKRLEVLPDVNTYRLYLSYYQKTWPQRRAEREAEMRSQPNPYDTLVNEIVAMHERDIELAESSKDSVKMPKDPSEM
jgi:hypothetical protein